VIILGALVAVWGGLVFAFAKPMHAGWKGMLRDMRRDGVKNDIPMTRFFASEDGLRKMRLAGGVGLGVGLTMIALGLVRGLMQ
jgi:hypothetical protein